MFSSVLYRIGIIFAILLVGALARWRQVLNKQTTDGLSRIAIEVTLPFLYFYTLATNLSRELFFSIISLPLIAVVLTFFFFVVAWLVSLRLKLQSGSRRTFMFLTTFPNYGFLAIPLIFALFGQAGLVRIFMFNLGITLLYWTLGVGMLSGPSADLKVLKNLVNNGTLALVLGVIVGVSGFSVPKFILEASNLIGNVTIPLALIVVGSILAQGNFKKAISLNTIAALIFCRLLLIPGLTILFIKNFCDLGQIIGAMIILQAALPSASTTPILVKRFGGDEQLAASGVFFTTLFSIITVPFFISLALQ